MTNREIKNREWPICTFDSIFGEAMSIAAEKSGKWPEGVYALLKPDSDNRQLYVPFWIEQLYKALWRYRQKHDFYVGEERFADRMQKFADLIISGPDNPTVKALIALSLVAECCDLEYDDGYW